MRLGKLDNCDLERLILNHFSSTRSECKTAPHIGEDCAIVDIDNDLMVLSSDPVTAASIEHLGRLSVYVNCNDVICCGADPVALMVTLLAPKQTTEADIEFIAKELSRCAKECNVDIVGGHTEITDAVTRAVTSTTVIARANRAHSLCGAQVGDYIIMTKYAGLEGSGIVATDHAALLSNCSDDTLLKCKACFDMLSIAKEGRLAAAMGAHAMHDVTEGGVLGAIWELTTRFGLGAVIDTSSIPILGCTREICTAAGLNPLRLIGSGSLLIACANGKEMLKALEDHGIPCAIVGRVQKGELVDEHGAVIAPPEADELYKLLP